MVPVSEKGTYCLVGRMHKLNGLPLSPEAFQNSSHGYVGRGGEHIVVDEPIYTFENDGFSVVHKVNVSPRIIAMLNPGADVEANYEVASEFARQMNSRHWDLIDAFGENHVVGQTTQPYVIEPSEYDAAYLWPNGAPRPDLQRLCTIATSQRVVRGLEQCDTPEGWFTSLYAPYAERLKPQMNADSYVTLHRKLFPPWDDWELQKNTIDQFLSLQSNPHMLAVVKALKSERIYEGSAVLLAAMKYTLETGEILDLAGERNIVFDKRIDSYLLVDAMLTVPTKVFHELPGIVHKIESDTLLSFNERLRLLNGLGYARTLNFLASLCGMPSRLAITDFEVSERAWYKIHEYLYQLTPGPVAIARQTTMAPPVYSDSSLS